MSKIKEPKAILAVLLFGLVFMVAFGVWHVSTGICDAFVPDLTNLINVTRPSCFNMRTIYENIVTSCHVYSAVFSSSKVSYDKTNATKKLDIMN